MEYWPDCFEQSYGPPVQSCVLLVGGEPCFSSSRLELEPRRPNTDWSWESSPWDSSKANTDNSHTIMMFCLSISPPNALQPQRTGLRRWAVCAVYSMSLEDQNNILKFM